MIIHAYMMSPMIEELQSLEGFARIANLPYSTLKQHSTSFLVDSCILL
jgi:hypothetical protein